MSRYRGSIYVDVWIDDDEVKGEVRQDAVARNEIDEIAKKIPNAFVGGVAKMVDGDHLGNLQRINKI